MVKIWHCTIQTGKALPLQSNKERACTPSKKIPFIFLSYYFHSYVKMFVAFVSFRKKVQKLALFRIGNMQS